MPKRKIFSRTALAKKCALLKKQGKIIVCANGCFDVLHVGHIRYLRGAKAEGDVLVVAINSDTSVRKIKGPSRPLVNERDRARILASMEMVDFVTIFNELTAEKTLKQLKPDVQAKGTDYTHDTVPERHLLGKYVGRVAIVGDPKNHSTRNVIAEIKRRFT